MLQRLTIAFLIAVMLMSLAACGNNTNQEKPSLTTPMETEPAESGEELTPDPVPASDEAALPEGAASPYELYCKIVDFLNGGFHYDDLREVFDPALSLAFYSKREEDEEDILTYGLDLKESYALVKGLADRADVLQLPLDEYGEFDDDDIDLERLREGLPAEIQAQLDRYPDAYEDFAENIYEYLFSLSTDDGRNPFGTGQTSWEKCAEGDLNTWKYDKYDDFHKDFQRNFPGVLQAELGRYEEGSEVYGMGFNYIEIDGRFYFLGFSTVVGGTGG